VGQRTRVWAADPRFGGSTAAGRAVQRTEGRWPTVGFADPTLCDCDIACEKSRPAGCDHDHPTADRTL